MTAHIRHHLNRDSLGLLVSLSGWRIKYARIGFAVERFGVGFYDYPAGHKSPGTWRLRMFGRNFIAQLYLLTEGRV